MSLLNPLSNAFGLDIGDRTFKIVQVNRHGKGKHAYRLTAWNTIDVPEGVMDKGDIKDADAGAKLLKKLANSVNGRLHGNAVVASLPETKTFIKIIEVPSGSSQAEMREAVRREIEQNIPLPPEEIYSDWQTIEEKKPLTPKLPPPENPKDRKSAKKNGGNEPIEAKSAPAEEATEGALPTAPVSRNTVKLLMGAVPKSLADSYTNLLERAGLVPIALEIEATAISRAVIAFEEQTEEAVGILDIGATRSSLVIYDSGALQMSISIPISGDDITKLVSESLSVSLTDAEKLKKECGLDANRCEDKMWNILLPLIDDITEKIGNALRFYKIGFPSGKKIEHVYLCGGGALFKEIDTVLSRKLTIRAQRGNALINLSPRLPKAFPKRDDALTYATAIGLAIRAADENAKHHRSLS